MSGFSFHIQPVKTDIESFLHKIFLQFFELKFDARACHKALNIIIEEMRLDPKFFYAEEILHGGQFCTEKLLIGDYDIYNTFQLITGIGYGNEYHTKIFNMVQSKELCKSLNNIVECVQLGDKKSALQLCETIYETEMNSDTNEGEQKNIGVWSELSSPGIYRREHASLIIKSDTTSVLTDPQSVAGCWTNNHGIYPIDNQVVKADAICITHAHHDHWNLPSVIAHSNQEKTAIFVPKVICNLLTTEDPKKMIDQMTALHAIESSWWEKKVVGDIEIITLPFYGEQPTVNKPIVDSRVRNWGNCYRFEVCDFSVLILSDSGTDPDGSVLNVLERSYYEHGPVDFLLSCCSEFPEIINPGLPELAFALNFSDLQNEFSSRISGNPVKSITLGLDGVVQACKLSRAKYFLPYAHGFAGIGKYDLSNIDENGLLIQLKQKLLENNVPTKIINWLPGDVIKFSDYV